jgi:hypothetical protein
LLSFDSFIAKHLLLASVLKPKLMQKTMRLVTVMTVILCELLLSAIFYISMNDSTEEDDISSNDAAANWSGIDFAYVVVCLVFGLVIHVIMRNIWLYAEVFKLVAILVGIVTYAAILGVSNVMCMEASVRWTISASLIIFIDVMIVHSIASLIILYRHRKVKEDHYTERTEV